MKKKALWIIGVCIILISIWGIREIYLYNNPEVIITYSNENTEEAHRSLPVYAINPKSRLAVLGEYVQFIVTISSASKEYDKEMKAWWEATNEVNLWLHNDLKAPMDVSSTVEIVDGTAKITYQGTATSLENEKVEIYKEVVIDFPVSANLEIEKTE